MHFTEYNTLTGIKKCLSSYEKFTEMIHERNVAGYTRGERMDTFYVLGRYMLDACGNVGVALDFIPAEKIKNFLQVVDRDTISQLLRQWDQENIPDVLTREHGLIGWYMVPYP